MTANQLPKSLLDNPALGSWISLERPGRVLVRSGKVELGQGIATALAQIVAEEVDVALDRIDMLPADTDRSPDEGLTAGSQSVEVSGASLRLAAAQARAALLAAAASRLRAELAAISCDDGTIHRDGAPTALDLWSLSADVDWLQAVTGQIPVKSVRTQDTVGTSAPRADLSAKMSGGGFIHDMTLDGMLHVRVVRQPFRLARLAHLDRDWLARRHPDLTIIRQQDFLALAGPDEYAIHRAHADADKFATWEDAPGRWQPVGPPAEKRIVLGGPEPAAAQGRTLTARYSRGAIAHASIGPSCALAHFEVGRLTVWAHSQGIFLLRAQIARCLNLDPSAVRVIHVSGAGCYGHNGADDAAFDAAVCAVALKERPVRVQWSRTDELSRGPLGAPMSALIEAALGADGRVASWRLSVLSAPHAQRPGYGGCANLSSAEALESARVPKTVEDLPDAAGGGASRNAVAIYDFPRQDMRVQLDTQSRVKTSALRSLGAHLNVFAIESAMDELAELAGIDPLEFRLRHLSDARCRAVLTGTAEMSGWPGGHPIGEGKGLGIAVARYKNRGAWLAAVVEVAVDEAVRVERLWLCVDAGLIINPLGARNQIEGGAIQTVSWTLKEEVKIEDDRVPALDWQSYPILKFSEIPQIETKFIVDPAQPPLGVGEAAQGPVAAAIGNAVSRALGSRVRDLPLTRDRVMDVLMKESGKP